MTLRSDRLRSVGVGVRVVHGPMRLFVRGWGVPSCLRGHPDPTPMLAEAVVGGSTRPHCGSSGHRCTAGTGRQIAGVGG